MKKILGLDLGTKTIGIAMTDELGIAAHGHETFRFEEFNYKKAREHVIELCTKNNRILRVRHLILLYSGADFLNMGQIILCWGWIGVA